MDNFEVEEGSVGYSDSGTTCYLRSIELYRAHADIVGRFSQHLRIFAQGGDDVGEVEG